jgi:predicted Zn-dependent peptidase
MELLTQAFWPDHPLGRPILGTKRTVGRFRREDLATYFARVYHPANLVIAAAGHVEHGELSKLVCAHFGRLRGAAPRATSRPPRPSRATVTRSKNELEQVHLCLGVPAPAHGDPGRYACHVLNTVLGGSMSSRLFQHVREQRGLVYSISSGIASYSDAGLLNVYAGTSLDSVPEVIRLTLEELRRLRGEPIPDDELRRAKDHMKGGLVLSLEGSVARMSHAARQEIHYGRQYPVEEILDRIERVTADDVQRLASSMFDGQIAASVLGSLRGWRPRRRELVV